MLQVIKNLFGRTWLGRVINTAVLHNQLTRSGVKVQSITQFGDTFAVYGEDADEETINSVTLNFGRHLRPLISTGDNLSLFSVSQAA